MDDICKFVSKLDLENVESYQTPNGVYALEAADNLLVEQCRLLQQLPSLVNHV